MSDHEQIEVITPEGVRVAVDAGMGRLLAALWKRGIKTSFSCQGGDAMDSATCHQCQGAIKPRLQPAYILFADLQSAGRFSEIINRRTWRWQAGKPSKKTPLRAWVQFPPADIRAIVKALRA